MFVGPLQRRANLNLAALAVLALTLVFAFGSSLWLMVNPTADQPLAAIFEGASGLGPANFLDTSDRDIFDSAARDAGRFQGEVDRLNAREKSARFEGAPLSDEEIRRIASYQQSFNEMARGERFVQDVLRGKARAREAWIVGAPVAGISLLGLALLGRRLWRARGGSAKEAGRAASRNPAVT